MQIQKKTVRDRITFDYENGGPAYLYYDVMIPKIINPAIIREIDKKTTYDSVLFRKCILGVASTTKATMRYFYKNKIRPKGLIKKIEGH